MKKYTLPEEGFADRESRAAFWREAITAQRKSKLTRIEFCNRNGLPQESFKNWVTKINKGTRAEFVQLKLEPEQKPDVPKLLGRLEIQLSGGDIIKLCGEPLPGLLEMAINVLERQRC